MAVRSPPPGPRGVGAPAQHSAEVLPGAPPHHRSAPALGSCPDLRQRGLRITRGLGHPCSALSLLRQLERPGQARLPGPGPWRPPGHREVPRVHAAPAAPSKRGRRLPALGG
eukprot:5436390-Alexandrium_andersonii.AAC.1